MNNIPSRNDVDLKSVIPQNLEAEQALLGALLLNNDIYDRVADTVDESHFYDPVHGRIYDVIKRRIQQNALASPMTVKSFLANDEGLAELGGEDYLVKLAAAAVAISAARDFAEIIRDAAIRRELIEIGDEISDRARKIDMDSNPSDQIVTAEQFLYKLAERGNTNRGFVSFGNAIVEAVQTAKKAFQRDGALSGISTGLIDLDRKIGGLHKSDLLILAGRPSMGKTSLVTNIAYNIAKSHNQSETGNEGGVVGFFSLEMSAEQLATRILSDAAEIPSTKIRSGEVDESEFRRFVEASVQLESSPLYIDDTPALPISALAARARRLKRQHGLDVLMVDYLQLLRGTGKNDNRVNEVSEITQGLKAIAKELDIPVIALSQLSRQVESRDDKRPQLSDLRESGSIEQDADVVMFVYREEYYTERERPNDDDPKYPDWQEKMARAHGKAEVVIGKQRHGPIGTVELSFEGQYTRFGNLARDRKSNTDDF